MSSPMLRTGRRKISPPFGGFTPADGRGYFYGPILCLAAQILRWPWLGIGAEKRGGSGGSPPHKVHGGQPGALLALPKAGNCHDPHSDTVRNGSGPGKFGTYDPRFDAKALNRPLFFEILTPCEKPVATGSAGHCEPGVGRFTDPHPFTCSFFTPPFCWLMFGLCAPPKILPNPVLCVEKNILFHRGHPVLQCAAFAGPTGSAFSFLLFHSFSHPPLLSGGKTSFLSAGG